MSFPLPANLQAIRKYYPDIHEKALAIRSKDRSLKYMASVWLAYYNIERPTCVREGCDKPTSWINSTHGFSNYCSCACANKDPVKKQKTEELNMIKFGAKYHQMTPEGQQKIKDANDAKFGGGCLRDPEVLEKRRNTMMKRYGVTNNSKSAEDRARAKQTLFDRLGSDAYKKIQFKVKQTVYGRYGEDAYKQFAVRALETKRLRYDLSELVLKSWETRRHIYGEDAAKLASVKSNQTKIERYGTANMHAVPEFEAKYQQTNIENYGVPHPMKSSIIRQKQMSTMQERYGVPYSFMINLKVSRIEREFSEFLDLHGIEYEREFLVEGLRYDFKIGNILVELNPIATHNTSWKPYGDKSGIDKGYHVMKTKLAYKNGFSCIHVWEWDSFDTILKLIENYNTQTLQDLGFMRKEDDLWVVDESKMSYRDVEGFGYERCGYREPQEEIHFTNNIESKMYRCGERLYKEL